MEKKTRIKTMMMKGMMTMRGMKINCMLVEKTHLFALDREKREIVGLRRAQLTSKMEQYGLR